MCSGKPRHPLCRPPRGSQPASRTMDARDKHALGKRSRGRSRASFYNGVRPHQALGYRTPRETFEAALACGYVDNASALTTSTEAPQQQQKDSIDNQNVLCGSTQAHCGDRRCGHVARLRCDSLRSRGRATHARLLHHSAGRPRFVRSEDHQGRTACRPQSELFAKAWNCR
jgi:hypothetical protein